MLALNDLLKPASYSAELDSLREAFALAES
jgi:hypothetical protein